MRHVPMSLRVKKAELLSALSYALDLTEGQPQGHGVRCCWIGMHIGRAIGLAEDDLSDLYYTLLLKDIGCSSNAARICQLFLTDDIEFKRDVKTVDESLPQVLRFLLSHTGMKAGFAERSVLSSPRSPPREPLRASWWKLVVSAVRILSAACVFPSASRQAFLTSTNTGTAWGNP